MAKVPMLIAPLIGGRGRQFESYIRILSYGLAFIAPDMGVARCITGAGGTPSVPFPCFSFSSTQRNSSEYAVARSTAPILEHACAK